MFGVARPSSRRQREKQPQSEEAPRPLRRGDVWIEIADVRWHEARRRPSDLKALGEDIRPRRHEHAACHRRREPFMRIDGDRVRRPDAGEQSTQALGGDQGAAPGGIDVEPGADGGRHRRAIGQRVDHAPAGRARGSDDHDRNASLRPIAGDRRRQGLRVHAARCIGIDQANGRPADARLVGDLEPGEVRVFRDVQGGRSGERPHAVGGVAGVRPGQGASQRGEVRLRAARREMPDGSGGETGTAGDRPDHVGLDLDRYRRRPGTRQLRVERCHDPLGTFRRE